MKRERQTQERKLSLIGAETCNSPFRFLPFHPSFLPFFLIPHRYQGFRPLFSSLQTRLVREKRMYMCVRVCVYADRGWKII